jgi:hypothetical protein
MLPRKAAVQREATLPPDRALKAITAQLDELGKLKGRRYDEASGDETKWQHQTHSIIEAVYGDQSSELSRFHMAKAAGQHNLMGVPPPQRQRNFELRSMQQSALLESLVATLRLHLPEEAIKGVYEPGDEYAFYRDLSSLIQSATQEIFIIDAYLDEQVFNLYVSKVPNNVPVRILSNKIGANVETIANMYVKSRPLELRSSTDIHDRAIFLDQRGWVSGASIKDAAKKKPAHLIEFEEPMLSASRDIHNAIWQAATVIV